MMIFDKSLFPNAIDGNYYFVFTIFFKISKVIAFNFFFMFGDKLLFRGEKLLIFVNANVKK